uniref:BTB domain-containing protein n=1 Tax=Panagrolaimus davidi TaxID=227884 RepID=A0A914NZQ0_9BILA
MLQQVNFVRTVQLAERSKMLIKVSDSIEFTVKRLVNTHTIHNIKGDFVITKITETYDNGERHDLNYNKSSPLFTASDRGRSETKTLTFYVTAMVEMPEETEPNSNELHGSPQESSVDENRPESIIPSPSSSKATTLLHKLATNNQFADVCFIFSDLKKIHSYRNILAASSDIFLKLFEESTEFPIEINADDFDGETIQYALNFLYDKSDSIIGKEMKVFKFAVKFGIRDLIDECRSIFEDSVDSTNVCEFIQIAYSNNFDELKQKCLKILAKKKEEIDRTKFDELPQNIVVDAFSFRL